MDYGESYAIQEGNDRKFDRTTQLMKTNLALFRYQNLKIPLIPS